MDATKERPTQYCLPGFETNKSNLKKTKDKIAKLNEQISSRGLRVTHTFRDHKGYERCYAVCNKHGKGHTWGSPWQPTYQGLKGGNLGCPKCGGVYRYTQEEYLALASQRLEKSGLSAVAYKGDYHHTQTPVLLRCKIHGLSDKWNFPCTPKLYIVLQGKATCRDCRQERVVASIKKKPLAARAPKKRNRTTLTMATTDKIKQTLVDNNSNLSFHGYLTQSTPPRKTQCKFSCPIHGNLWELNPPVMPMATTASKNPPSCPQCKKTSDDDLVLALTQSMLNCDVKVGRLFTEPGHNRRASIKCGTHGDSETWELPWIPEVSELTARETPCLKCAGRYTSNEQGALRRISEFTSLRKITFHGFHEQFKTPDETLCKISCETHGDCWEWDQPWLPSVQEFLVKKMGCNMCAGGQPISKEMRIKIANKQVANKGLFVLGIYGQFKKALSKVLIQCEKHGNGWEWDTPWTPSFDNLRGGKGCPKCSKIYRVPQDTLLAEARESAERTGLTLYGIIGKYIGVRTKCHVRCHIHGDGLEMDKPWMPEIRKVIDGAQCTLCQKATSSLGAYLTNKKETGQSFRRTLYYIAFEHKSKMFYKIGLAPEKRGVKGRFYPYMLLNDEVSIAWYHETVLDNGLALFLEAAIISFFSNKRRFACRILVNSAGGTECFGEDIFDQIDFDRLITYGIENYHSILADKTVYGESLKDATPEDVAAHIESLTCDLKKGFASEKKLYNVPANERHAR